MKKELVRCWAITLPNVFGKHESGHWITYPEENQGHDLVSCSACGQIYAVDVSRMVYVGPPLTEKLKTVTCVSCGRNLSETAKIYPEHYLDHEGGLHKFDRHQEIPRDEDSLVREFYQIYGPE